MSYYTNYLDRRRVDFFNSKEENDTLYKRLINSWSKQANDYIEQLSKDDIEEGQLNDILGFYEDICDEMYLAHRHARRSVNFEKHLEQHKASKFGEKIEKESPLTDKEKESLRTNEECHQILTNYLIPKHLIMRQWRKLDYSVGTQLQAELQIVDSEEKRQIEFRYQALREAFKKFISEAKDQDSLPTALNQLKSSCKSIEEQVKDTLKKHRGLHSREKHPVLNVFLDVLRGFIGVIAFILTIPCRLINNAATNRYVETFFNAPKTTSLKRSEQFLEAVNEMNLCDPYYKITP